MCKTQSRLIPDVWLLKASLYTSDGDDNRLSVIYCLIAKRLHVCDNLTYFNQELIVDTLDLIAILLLPQHSWFEHSS